MIWWMLACGSGTSEPAGPPLSTDVKDATPEVASFLAGCWYLEEGEKGSAPVVQECWQERGKYLNGTLDDKREGASPSLQLMRLAVMQPKEGLALGVQLAGNPPGGSKASGVLPLVGRSDDALEFRRDGTGYPTLARYELKGDTLTATYRGTIGDETVENVYSMKRKANPTQKKLEVGKSATEAAEAVPAPTKSLGEP